jgi:cytochrome P450
MLEEAPVSTGKISLLKLTLAARYDDCGTVLTDDRFIRNRGRARGKGTRPLPFPLPKSLAAVARSMILEDDPEHRRLRNLVNRAFDRPDQFDITRSPNHHLGFGQGQHFCLGKQLALMETRVALQNLFERNPNLRLSIPASELRVAATPGWHRHEHIPVTLR